MEFFTNLVQFFQTTVDVCQRYTLGIFIICAALFNSQTIHAQTQSLTLDYNSVEASAFPAILSRVMVKDGKNEFVGALTEDNFIVYEDDIRQLPITVEAFGTDSGGVSVVLIMDISGSMRQELPDAKQAAIKLARLLTPFDQGALISFDYNVYLVQNFTSDMNRLIDAISSLENGGGTSVYDAVLEGIKLTQTQQGRKAIVLLTDGRDSDSSADLDDVLKQLTGSKTPVYAIGLGIKSGRGEEELRTIAQTSGGNYYRAPTTSELEEIYRSIAFMISRYHYRITYTTSNCAADGTLRQVRIEAQKDGVAASDTNSYRAPKYSTAIALFSDQQPSPTLPFTLKIAIPDTTKNVTNLSDGRFRVR
jgi:VWFA-related protein